VHQPFFELDGGEVLGLVVQGNARVEQCQAGVPPVQVREGRVEEGCARRSRPMPNRPLRLPTRIRSTSSTRARCAVFSSAVSLRMCTVRRMMTSSRMV